MNALWYIIRRTVANFILGIIRRPVRLIAWLIVIAGIVAFIAYLATRPTETDLKLGIDWLGGVLFVALAGALLLGVRTGLRKGDTVFQLSDVNLIFTSPIDPRSALTYGLSRMAVMSLAMGLFILFQPGTVRAVFGVPGTAVLWIFGGFLICETVIQVATLLIYAATNSSPTRKNWVRIGTAVFFAPLLVVGVIQISESSSALSGIQALLASPVLGWYPLIGWATGGTMAFISGEWLSGLLGWGLCVGLGVLVFVALRVGRADYYEDVLVNAETAFEKQRAVADGQIGDAFVMSQTAKVRGVGLAGTGASALFFKHVRESFRENRLGFWNVVSLILVAAGCALAVALRDQAGGTVIVFGMLAGMQTMFVGMGRGLRELYTHYLFMIPEPGLAKLLWSNAELLIKSAGEGLVVFLVAGIAARDPGGAVAGFFGYLGFTVLLVGVNIFSGRWSMDTLGPGLQLLVYYALIGAALGPGIVAVVIIALLPFGTLTAAIWALAIWCFGVGIAAFAGSQGVLNRMDIATMPQPKS